MFTSRRMKKAHRSHGPVGLVRTRREPSPCRYLSMDGRDQRLRYSSFFCGFFRPLTDGRHHLRLIGKLACLQLGVQQLAIDGQFEAAAAAWDELQFLDLLLVRAEQLGRQTDGLRFVISHRTVLQLHVHEWSLFPIGAFSEVP